jgi:hypothetical protein
MVGECSYLRKKYQIIMTREEVAEIILYSKEHGINYKSRLEDLGIPAWKLYDSKSHYAREDESRQPGEFLELKSSGRFVPMPSFASTSGRRPSTKHGQSRSGAVSIDLRTRDGTMMRIQGDLGPEMLMSIIQAARRDA